MKFFFFDSGEDGDDEGSARGTIFELPQEISDILRHRDNDIVRPGLPGLRVLRVGERSPKTRSAVLGGGERTR